MVPNLTIAPGELLGRLGSTLRQGDIALAIGIIGILVVLILPMPRLLLDLLLAVSITFSVLVLLTSLFIEKPLEFSAFPVVLLIATMLRLALNLASTRLILADGHEGTAAAGRVIQAFGGFIMQGNFVIGLIVFAILVIVNFVVITRGSGRIAEVSARFSLDAMPGKQMAIDADLSAGLIDEQEAKKRRRQLEEESSFYGAMDGAAKFVRGDAIAGLLITFINLIGGLIIGVGQMGVSLAEAARSYTLLTVGDGLVSQIPALIVSTAAGLLVAKAGVAERTDRALFGQFGAHPRALATTSGLLALLAVLPGLPLLPFLLLSGASGALAWRLGRPSMDEAAATEGGGEAAERGADQRRARHGSASARARLRSPRADRRGGWPQAHRSDQGAAPAARGRARLRHAAGPHPGQHPAAGQHLRGQAQGGRNRARRAPPEHAAGHGPQGRQDHPSRRRDHRADLRSAGHVARSRICARRRAFAAIR